MKLAVLSVFLATLILFAKSQKWIPVDASEIENNHLIKELLTFGVDLLIEEGHKDGMIPDNDLVLQEIDSVETSSAGELRYRYHVVMGNKRGATLTAVYIVDYDPETGEKSLDNEYRGYDYEASYSEL